MCSKALCVVLLLFSASFYESRKPKNELNSRKRMVGGNALQQAALARRIAVNLRGVVRQRAQNGSMC